MIEKNNFKKIILILILILSFINGFTQKINSYYYLLNKGDSLYYNKNYSEAFKYYSSAIHQKKYTQLSDILKFADCALKTNEQKACFKLYKLALLNGCSLKVLKSYLKSDSLFSEIYKNKLLNKFTAFNRKYYARLNMDAYDKINELVGYDEGFRIGQIYIPDSVCYKEYIDIYYKKEKRDDSLNLIQLIDLIKKYGWLDFEQIGAATNNMSTLIWHHRGEYCETESWKYLKEIILKQIEIGELLPYYLIPYEDNIYFLKNKMTLYGTMVVYDKGKFVYYPIYDVKNVDKRRKEVGLLDLKTDALRRNAVLPEEYLNGINNK